MPVTRMTRAEITDTARRIVTNDLLVADLSDGAWQSSLALIISGLPEREIEKVGLILVPLGPHLGTYWVNGIAPGCTFSATLIHVNDFARLDAEVTRMNAVLYPEDE